MKIKRFDNIFENNIDYYVSCSDSIYDVFGDTLTISNVQFLEDVEYNFQCVVRTITKESYATFKILFDLIEKNSSDFIVSNSKCYAKIINIEAFCTEIKSIKL